MIVLFILSSKASFHAVTTEDTQEDKVNNKYF